MAAVEPSMAKTVNMSGSRGARQIKQGKRQEKKTNDFEKVKNTLFVQPDTALFCQVYLDPFVTKPASLPVTPLLSHQSIRTYCSGRGITNANGNGWITVQPANMAINDTAVPSVTWTTASTASDDIGFGLTITGASTASSNSPYSFSNFLFQEAPSLQMRIVALGIRVRYVGTVLNAAGTVYTCEIEAKSSLTDMNGWNITTIKAQPCWKEYAFDRNVWHSVTRTIQSDMDYQYQQNAESVGWIYAGIGEASGDLRTLDAPNNLSIYMEAQPAAPFEWEVSAHFEIIGQNLPERKVIKTDRNIVENLASSQKTRRFMNTTTKDHAVGVAPTSSGGFLGFLKDSAKTLIPMIPEFLAMLL
jgi:hypothetical protein